MNLNIEWHALLNIIIFGVLVGAGLPTLFALGIRLLAAPAEPGAEQSVSIRSTGLRRIGGYACFAVILGAVGTGLVFIVLGGH